MAVFYVLPPRPLLGDRFVEFLQELFPGLFWDASTRLNLTEALTAAATCHPDVFVVYRDELADGESTGRALRDGFGAEVGDDVIEVNLGSHPGELKARCWSLRAAA